MKILNLEIKHVRGIKEISLSPNGENVVVYGPNGSGKSAVVDAIDFLLTGEISRLTGRGTGGITLKDHGPHIDYQPKDAVVKAVIKIDGLDDSISIERRMSKPKTLIYPKEKEEFLKDILVVAERGQHVLSRSEILKYIATEASKRAEEIQALLNLSPVEDLRKKFETIKRDANRGAQADKINFETSMNNIKTRLSIGDFSEAEVLKKANEFRTVLKGASVGDLNVDKLQDGITPFLGKDDDNRVDPELLKRYIDDVKGHISDNGELIYSKEVELRRLTQMLKENSKLKKDLESKRLIDIGISLIDDSGECPLCLKEWEPDELKQLLKDRLSNVKEAEKIETQIKELASEIDSKAGEVDGLLVQINKYCETMKLDDIVSDLKDWNKRLSKWQDNLKKAATDYASEKDIDDGFKVFLSPEKLDEHLEKILKASEGMEKLTPEQKAWDTLTELKPLLERYFEDKKKYEDALMFAKRATVTSKIYTDSKDKVLEGIYKSVNDDFTTYYRYLHGEDEKDFASTLKPDGASLDMKVDFYGRGLHHPRALHSEGHQDSMGLCLYLALCRKLTEGKINIIILDDVVMSIDNNHRRSICRMLQKYFPDRQFLITTHNSTWARQLKTDGIVKKQNMCEFRGWTIDTGPKYSEGEDYWDQILNDLEDNQVSSAAHKLRINSERYYDNVCDSLMAEIPYSGDHRWDFGIFVKGAITAYKKYLKKAKDSANSWSNKEDIEKLNEIDTIAKEVIGRSQVEEWGINANVHHSKWDDFSMEDFLPIAEAFRDLETLFRCSKCQGLLSVNIKDMVPQNIACPCGTVLWNLVKKS